MAAKTPPRERNGLVSPLYNLHFSPLSSSTPPALPPDRPPPLTPSCTAGLPDLLAMAAAALRAQLNALVDSMFTTVSPLPLHPI